MKSLYLATVAAMMTAAPASAAVIVDRSGTLNSFESVSFGVELVRGVVFRARVELSGDLDAFDEYGRIIRASCVSEDLPDGGVNDYCFEDETIMSPAGGRVYEVVTSRDSNERDARLGVVILPLANTLPGGTLNYRVVISDDLPGPGPAVPEPATWAMMIGGFGLIGAAARRRARVRVAFG